MKQRKRSEIEVKDTWDLTVIYQNEDKQNPFQRNTKIYRKSNRRSIRLPFRVYFS